MTLLISPKCAAPRWPRHCAVPEVKEIAHYTTKALAGHGAVRQTVELVLTSKGHVGSDHRQSACVTQSPVFRFRLFSSQIRLEMSTTRPAIREAEDADPERIR
jgi:hypothetical protein